jgi:hypothetical protein
MERDLRSMPSHGASTARFRPAVLLAALACGQAAADAALQFTIADVSGEGWRAGGVSIELRRNGDGRLAARISAASLELPPPLGRLESLSGGCHDLVITPRRFICDGLSLGAPGRAPEELSFQGRLEYRRDTGALAWDLALPEEHAGKLRFTGGLDGEGWVADFSAGQWPIAQLAGFGALLGFEPPALAGAMDLSLFARGSDAGLQGLVFDLAVSDFAGSNDKGTLAAEGVRLALRGSAWPEGEQLGFDVRGHAGQGEAYAEPVYANLEDHPVRITARGLTGERGLSIRRLIIEQQGTVHADAAGEIERTDDGAWQLSSALIELPRAELPGAYTVLLQPFLAGTPLNALDTSGLLRGEIALTHGQIRQARIELFGVNLDDQDARLAVYDLSGDLAWSAPGAAGRPLELRWSGGFVYGIPFGASSIRLEPAAGAWVLAQPVSIPLLDGALEIDTVELGDFAAGDDTLLFDARLTPVSMRELSRALDWPPLSGQLSGTLPRLRHEDGVVALGGEFAAEIFGGTVAIRGLRIERPLQQRARLQADLELRELDLAELTEAFAFGLMTGRLEGYVRGLEMIDWAPVAFDARLQTPPGDRSRKRISQRAVDNIASIGGGGAGMLSTGFLRFFESFSYEAFALGCRLENDVCQMSGLDDRDQGYAILQGRGLPRIDVMGFARRVDWSLLVEQLAGIMESEGPEIR